MKKINALFVFAILTSLNMSSQNFTNEPILQNRPPEKKVTFWDVQKAFECYWDSLQPSVNEEENADSLQKAMASLQQISAKMGSADCPTDTLFRAQLQRLMTEIQEGAYDNTPATGCS